MGSAKQGHAQGDVLNVKPADRPLQILLLCYEYPPIGGGGGVGAQRYAEEWASAGHRVTVLTGEYFESLTKYWK